MTEPDEALLWAREDWAKGLKSKGARRDVHQGLWDECLDDAVRGYRAGAAASEARIKALEGLLGHFLGLYCGSAFWDVEKEPEVIEARALLKEDDQ